MARACTGTKVKQNGAYRTRSEQFDSRLPDFSIETSLLAQNRPQNGY